MIPVIFHSSIMVFPIRIVSVDHNLLVGVRQQPSMIFLFIQSFENIFLTRFSVLIVIKCGLIAPVGVHYKNLIIGLGKAIDIYGRGNY